MRRPAELACVLCGLLLAGCDFYTGRAIVLIPEGSYLPEETNVALRSDFDKTTTILADFALSEGFDEVVAQRQRMRKVYQKNTNDRVFQLIIAYLRESDAITVEVLEMQTRKRSDTLDKMYGALRDSLQAEFGDRIRAED